MPFSQVISVPDDHFLKPKKSKIPHLAEIRSPIWRKFVPPFGENGVVKARIAEKITYT